MRARTLLLAPLFAALAACGVELQHGLDERQANEVAAALETEGIIADKLADDGGRWKVSVPRGDLGRAVAVLEAADLPSRTARRGLGDTFAQSSILPSLVEERARYTAALTAEIEQTLSRVPGASGVRVHLGLPDDDVGRARPRPTASVLLRHRGGLGIGDADVRRLVAGAVPELREEDVRVVIAAAHDAPAAPPLERFGPVGVARGSRPALAMMAVSALAVIASLAAALVYVTIRLLRLRRQLRGR